MESEFGRGGMVDIDFALAEFVAALWAIGPGSDETLSAGGGVVDRALYDIHNELPSIIVCKLSFSIGSVGRCCHQWPQAENVMRYSLMAEIDGNTFTRLRVLLEKGFAHQVLLGEYKLAAQVRRNLAEKFYNSVREHEKVIQLQ
jgi:hypothetical protein